VSTDQIPSELIFHILVWYLKTRLIPYFCTQSGKLAHVHMSQQFCVGCDCFIVAVFHWHGVLFLYI